VTSAERDRDRYLRQTYGITLEEYRVILAFQGGVCAVCRRPPVNRPLHVDHDHVTRRVRGLLCYDCNHRVVGRQRDPEKLRAAARYLERPPADEAMLAL
jgi:DNA-directed RNA polymerase subunit RPC12/RpoP